jgi:hypothetical protein
LTKFSAPNREGRRHFISDTNQFSETISLQHQVIGVPRYVAKALQFPNVLDLALGNESGTYAFQIQTQPWISF